LDLNISLVCTTTSIIRHFPCASAFMFINHHTQGSTELTFVQHLFYA
jgi:hypothetical protein